MPYANGFDTGLNKEQIAELDNIREQIVDLLGSSQVLDDMISQEVHNRFERQEGAEFDYYSLPQDGKDEVVCLAWHLVMGRFLNSIA